jgi:hypothetical protein
VNRNQMILKAAVATKRSSSDLARGIPVKPMHKDGKECIVSCFPQIKICLPLVSSSSTQKPTAPNASLVYEVNGKCCYRVLEKFKEHIISELPQKIRQDTVAHSSTLINRFRNSQPTKLKIIVISRIQELFETYCNKRLPLLHTPQPLAESIPKSSKSASRAKPAVPTDPRSGFSVNGFPRSSRQKTPSSKRRADSDVSPETRARHRAPKRVAVEEYGVP